MIFRGRITPLDIDAIFVYIVLYFSAIALLIIKHISEKFLRKDSAK